MCIMILAEGYLSVWKKNQASCSDAVSNFLWLCRYLRSKIRDIKGNFQRKQTRLTPGRFTVFTAVHVMM